MNACTYVFELSLALEQQAFIGHALLSLFVVFPAQRDDVATGQAAQSVAEALTELVESSRNVAACCPTDRAGQELLLTAVATCLSASVALLQAGRDTVTSPGDGSAKQNLVLVRFHSTPLTPCLIVNCVYFYWLDIPGHWGAVIVNRSLSFTSSILLSQQGNNGHGSNLLTMPTF